MNKLRNNIYRSKDNIVEPASIYSLMLNIVLLVRIEIRYPKNKIREPQLADTQIDLVVLFKGKDGIPGKLKVLKN